MSEHSLEITENQRPLVYIALTTVATFGTATMLIYLLTLIVDFP